MPRISNMLMRKDLTPFDHGISKKQATLKHGIVNIENFHLNSSMMTESSAGNNSNRFPINFLGQSKCGQEDLSEYKSNFKDFSKSPKNQSKFL